MSDTIRTLKEIFENNNIDLCKNMLITNYDKKIVGTFHAGVYKEAIQRFNKDFMVSSFDDDGQLISITIEEINPDTLVIVNLWIFMVKLLIFHTVKILVMESIGMNKEY